MAASKSTNILVWILMLMLIVGLGGFGISNFSGSVREVGRVGDTPITTDQYFRALNRALDESGSGGAPLPLSEARARGVDQQVLSQLIARAAIDEEARRIGLSVGDGAVQEALLQVPVFQGLTGGFDREAYDFWLDRNGFTAAEFETQLRSDLARGLLLDAAAGGLGPRPAYTDLILTYLGERRSFVWAPVGPDMLTDPIPDPDADQISAWYDANPDAYTAPETRQITYVWLSPDTVMDGMEADEDALRALYDDRADLYNQPERRLVERLVYPDQAAAEAARARLDAGTSDFDALVAERGLDLADVDLGDVRAVDLAPEAAAAVFGSAEPGVVGPVPSALGPALFRVNAILDARVTPFDDVRDVLARVWLADAARAEIVEQAEGLRDLLAGGATLEDLADKTDMVLGTVDFTGAETAMPAADPAFRDTALAADTGTFPDLQETGDGGVFALRVDAIIPPALQPLDAVRDRVIADWRAAETARQLAAKAEDLQSALDSGDSFTSLGLEARDERDVTRARPPADLPPLLLETVFAMTEGAVAVAATPDGDALIRLTRIAPPDPDDAQLGQIADVLAQAARQGQADDITALFAVALGARFETLIDSAAINAVQAQIR
jgi:peptidyl-prolyl cis-trans isomerase D